MHKRKVNHVDFLMYINIRFIQVTSEETKLVNADFKSLFTSYFPKRSEIRVVPNQCNLSKPSILEISTFFYSCGPLPVIDVVLKVEEN